LPSGLSAGKSLGSLVTQYKERENIFCEEVMVDERGSNAGLSPRRPGLVTRVIFRLRLIIFRFQSQFGSVKATQLLGYVYDFWQKGRGVG